ncbi:MAG: PLDc N-terminal domain-containing protein [Cellulosilyticaceae bacterium]
MSLSEFMIILPDVLPFLIPIILLLCTLMITALVSVLKKELPLSQKVIWIVIIVFINMIGPLIYFAVGSKLLDEKVQFRNEVK